MIGQQGGNPIFFPYIMVIRAFSCHLTERILQNETSCRLVRAVGRQNRAHVTKITCKMTESIS